MTVAWQTRFAQAIRVIHAAEPQALTLKAPTTGHFLWDALSSKTMAGLSKFRVLVVEDHVPFRRFISSTLKKKRNLQIIGEVCDGLEAIQKAEQLKPDLIFLDIGIPKLNGFDVAREIRRRVRESKIIFVTSECDEDLMQEAFTLGASGYVVKTMAGSDLLPALEAVTSGKQFASSTTGGPHFHIDSAHAPDLPINCRELDLFRHNKPENHARDFEPD